MSLKHHKTKTDPEPMSPSQLAHELNNLLDGSLRGVGMVLRQLRELELDESTRGQLDKYLSTADQSMRLMADVVERYANGQPDRAPSLNDLVRCRGSLLDVLTHAVNVYGPAIEQRGVELVTRLDPAVCDLPAGAVYTVLANGINNALQAIEAAEPAPPEHTHRITVRILEDHGDVVVQVADSGDGIDPQLLDEHGEFRFGITTRPQGHGVGLGVCRQIAEDLGGDLDIAHRADGPGSELTLRFPKQSLAVVDDATRDPGDDVSGGGGETRRAG